MFFPYHEKNTPEFLKTGDSIWSSAEEPNQISREKAGPSVRSQELHLSLWLSTQVCLNVVSLSRSRTSLKRIAVSKFITGFHFNNVGIVKFLWKLTVKSI